MYAYFVQLYMCFDEDNAITRVTWERIKKRMHSCKKVQTPNAKGTKIFCHSIVQLEILLVSIFKVASPNPSLTSK